MIFQRKMIKEIVKGLTRTKESLLYFTGLTKSIFTNYKGEEFLKIETLFWDFQHANIAYYKKLTKF